MTEPIQYRTSARHAAGARSRASKRRSPPGGSRPGRGCPRCGGSRPTPASAPSTVPAGLAELRRRGVVVTEPRRGTRVGERPPIAPAARRSISLPGARAISRTATRIRAAARPHARCATARSRSALRRARRAGRAGRRSRARALRARWGSSRASCASLSGALDGIERVIAACTSSRRPRRCREPRLCAAVRPAARPRLALEPVAVDERGIIHSCCARRSTAARAPSIVTPRGQNPTGAALDAGRAPASCAPCSPGPRACCCSRTITSGGRRRPAAHARVRPAGDGRRRARLPRRSVPTCASPCSRATLDRSRASRAASNAVPAGSATSCSASCSACGRTRMSGLTAIAPRRLRRAAPALLDALERAGVQAAAAPPG